MAADLNSYLKTLTRFLDERDLQLSVPKCFVTLFTPNTREHKTTPKVTINGEDLPLNKTSKLLGVTFDTAVTFTNYVKLAAKKTELTSKRHSRKHPGANQQRHS